MPYPDLTPAESAEAIAHALSIRAIPYHLLPPTDDARHELVRRAERGEECCAYPRFGSEDWCIWLQDDEHPDGWRCSPQEWRAYWLLREAIRNGQPVARVAPVVAEGKVSA